MSRSPHIAVTVTHPKEEDIDRDDYHSFFQWDSIDEITPDDSDGKAISSWGGVLLTLHNGREIYVRETEQQIYEQIGLNPPKSKYVEVDYGVIGAGDGTDDS